MVNGLNLGVSIFSFIVATMLWYNLMKDEEMPNSWQIFFGIGIISNYISAVLNMYLAFK